MQPDPAIVSNLRAIYAAPDCLSLGHAAEAAGLSTREAAHALGILDGPSPPPSKPPRPARTRSPSPAKPPPPKRDAKAAALDAVRALHALGQPFGTGDVALRLGVTKPRASQLVEALVDEGLVVRWRRVQGLTLPGCQVIQLAEAARLKRLGQTPVTAETPPARVLAVMRRVAEEHDVLLVDLLGSRRTRLLAQARRRAMREVRALTLLNGEPPSTPQIGRWFGGRDHTTVLHALKRAEGEVS